MPRVPMKREGEILREKIPSSSSSSFSMLAALPLLLFVFCCDCLIFVVLLPRMDWWNEELLDRCSDGRDEEKEELDFMDGGGW